MTGIEWNQKTTCLYFFPESHLYHTEPDRDPDVSNVHQTKLVSMIHSLPKGGSDRKLERIYS